MKKVLYVTNLPAPYKIAFFEELSKKINLTVAYERKKASNRNNEWKSDIKRNYKEIYLHGKTIGAEWSLSIEIIQVLKKNHYDIVLMNGYSSPTAMIAIFYMRIFHIKYVVVCDGMLPASDNKIKKWLKKYFISGAYFCMSSGDITKQQLIKYGADEQKIYWYPFSSVSLKEVVDDIYNKEIYKEKVECKSSKMVLFVGQIIYRKGIDTLIEAFKKMNNSDVQLYIVGGEKNEFNKITQSNIRFVEFKKKEDLIKYYQAADLFVLPTREDIWGLVINEALSKGVPVLTTNCCGAGMEILKENKGGKIIMPDDPDALASSMSEMLADNVLIKLKQEAFTVAKKYTIENMAKYIWDVIDKVPS